LVLISPGLNLSSRAYHWTVESCDASAVSLRKVGPAREPHDLYAVHVWTRAGNRGFSGARSVPGADVWRWSETSRSLEPDGWL